MGGWRYFLIINPGSRGGKSRQMIQRLLNTLDGKGVQYTYRITAALEEASAFSAEANQEGYDVIVAVGGDGTINRVINGFYDSGGRRISGAKLGVIYTGTSPDFCKSYGLPVKTEEALQVLLAGHSQEIRMGKIVHADEKDETKTSYFACCANIGLGAALARCANSGIRKYLGDQAGTFVSLLKTLLVYRPSAFMVRIDGKKQQLDRVYSISVGRTTYIASGIKVKNDLAPGDDGFYILIVKNMGWVNWPGVIRKIYSGQKFENDDVISLQYGRAIEIHGNKLNPELEFDGDPRGFLPCSIEMAPDPLELISVVRGAR